MSIARIMMQAAAGSAGGGGVPIEEAFSADLYTGNGSTQTITNGIDLAGEGGLVWVKARSSTLPNGLYDTARGATNELVSSSTAAQQSVSGVTSFNSNGFSLGTRNAVNQNGQTFVAWSFRKAPRFFDVVTYTGNGNSTGQILNHNLGCRAGQVVIKQTDGAGGDWYVASYNGSSVYHYNFGWNRTTASDRSYDFADTTYPINDTQFTTFIGSASDQTNASGLQYVAYIFAHDIENTGVIKCGSYTGTGSTLSINLGWEPQWLMIKRYNNDGSWHIFPSNGSFTGAEGRLAANLSNGESALDVIESTVTGFNIVQFDGDWNTGGGEYIYVAIRAEGV